MKDDGNQDWRLCLYENKAAQLLLYGRALGLSHGESEDVLQETFLALLGMKSQPIAPERYAVKTFRHRAFNYRRGLWRRLTRELESSRWFETTPGESELERAAVRCLEELPAEQKEVIVLKTWHGYTFEDIGAMLEVSPNTAAARYRYGLQKLRNCLQGDDYAEYKSDRESDEFPETARTFRPA